MFTSLGMSVAAMLQELPSFQVFISLLIMPVFFLSGALFPLNNVPKYLAIIARVNPFAYGVDGMRSAFFGDAAHFGSAVDLSVMVGITLLLLAYGSYLFSRIEA
jgi:ABC-2 type transport system permease protein